VYSTPQDLPWVLEQAQHADLVVKHSGVGADDELLEREVALTLKEGISRAFWDVDAPATLTRVEANPGDPFRRLIPEYALIFTYGGGPPVVEHFLRLGASFCHPIYNGLDPETHYPIAPDPDLGCDLVLVANRLPDREKRVEDFFLRAAGLAP